MWYLKTIKVSNAVHWNNRKMTLETVPALGRPNPGLIEESGRELTGLPSSKKSQLQSACNGHLETCLSRIHLIVLNHLSTQNLSKRATPLVGGDPEILLV